MAVQRRSAPKVTDYMEDDEETPRKRRPRVDEDEERPARSRRNRYDDDDEEEEETPRPRKKKKSKSKAEPVRKRPVEDDDEEEEDPDELPERSSVIQRGWAAARKAAAASSDFTDEFKFDEEAQVVKFLDDNPVVYDQHWVEELGKGRKKSYICLGDDCPLCEELGHRPSARFAFSVVNLSLEDMPIQILQAGVRVSNTLDKHNSNKRTGPLSRQFWALSRTGTGRDTNHQVMVVKGRDLPDDWDIDPEDVEARLEKAKPLDLTKELRTNTVRELQDIVDELL